MLERVEGGSFCLTVEANISPGHEVTGGRRGIALLFL